MVAPEPGDEERGGVDSKLDRDDIIFAADAVWGAHGEAGVVSAGAAEPEHHEVLLFALHVHPAEQHVRHRHVEHDLDELWI